jgi:hypothetical protein
MEVAYVVDNSDFDIYTIPDSKLSLHSGREYVVGPEFFSV